jgi:molybdopterin synthase sulfur carrier subunit
MDDASEVTVTLPGILARFTGGRRNVPVAADTLGEAIDRLVEAHPELESHLFDGAGNLRAHLGLYRNGEGVAWDDVEAVELDDGDEVLVLQAVSGG